MMPAAENEPGALEARAPEFLDFLLANRPLKFKRSTAMVFVSWIARRCSPLSRRFPSWALLRFRRFSRLFRSLDSQGPTDPFAQFLQAGKMAFWQATVNSRQWAQAKSGGRRGAAGLNTYWLPIE